MREGGHCQTDTPERKEAYSHSSLARKHKRFPGKKYGIHLVLNNEFNAIWLGRWRRGPR